LVALFKDQGRGIVTLGQQAAHAFENDKVLGVVEIAGSAVSKDNGFRIVNGALVDTDGNDVFACRWVVEPPLPAILRSLSELQCFDKM
jgi:hypothetical protein